MDVEPGRIAILRLDGPSGSLDIVTVYLPTGQAEQQRAAIRDRASMFIRPAARALTVMIGDWNFVREARDRIHFDSGAWNGGQDEQEHDDFA